MLCVPLLWQANIQSFICGRQQRLYDPGQAASIANGVCKLPGDPAGSGQGQMETSIKTITDKPAKTPAEPVFPVVQECTDKNKTLSDNIQLKEDYKPVSIPLVR